MPNGASPRAYLRPVTHTPPTHDHRDGCAHARSRLLPPLRYRLTSRDPAGGNTSIAQSYPPPPNLGNHSPLLPKSRRCTAAYGLTDGAEIRSHPGAPVKGVEPPIIPIGPPKQAALLGSASENVAILPISGTRPQHPRPVQRQSSNMPSYRRGRNVHPGQQALDTVSQSASGKDPYWVNRNIARVMIACVVRRGG
jgi:hypothetical protein